MILHSKGTQTIDVSASIIVQNNTVLLCKRKPGKSLGGYWEFPGGRIEEGESPQQCLEREIWEELGIEIVAGKTMMEHTHHYDFGIIHLIAIESKVLTGEIELSVHDEYQWVPISKLLTYKLAPADIPFAQHLMGE